MFKTASLVAIGLWLALTSVWQGQKQWRDACVERCYISSESNTDLEREEIVNLEREAAHAIQLNDGTFFRRVYSDDFAATLSHGQLVNKAQWVGTIEQRSVAYESFHASDIKVRIFENTAVATCLWSARFVVRGQHISSQLRVLHVYVNTPSGWHVVSGQNTNLPPDISQPL
jgi:ketosteroid isomerase-like protein